MAAPPVSIVVAEPTPVAVVIVQTTFAQLPQEMRRCLDLVHAAAGSGAIRPRGHAVAIYRRLGAGGTVEASIGMQVAAPFEAVGEVRCRHTPAGRAATLTHVGPYDGLAATHTDILEWATDAGAELAGVSWEVYGDWEEDPAKRVTEVYHLLDIEPSVVDY